MLGCFFFFLPTILDELQWSIRAIVDNKVGHIARKKKDIRPDYKHNHKFARKKMVA